MKTWRLLGAIWLVAMLAWLGPPAWERWAWRWNSPLSSVTVSAADVEARRDMLERSRPKWHEPFFVATMPSPVRDVWYDVVLLEGGTVLLTHDLLRLRRDPGAALPPAPPGPTHLQSIYARHRAALWSDGTVRADHDWPVRLGHQDIHPWSREYHPRYDAVRPRPRSETAPHDLNDVTSVITSAWQDFTVVLRRNGQVHVFGRQDEGGRENEFGELGLQQDGPDGVPGFVAGNARGIAAGARHGLMLRDDGSVWMWGQDDPTWGPALRSLPADAFRPELRRIDLPQRAVKVAAGGRSSFALLADGTVWAWGNSTCGALGASPHELPPEAGVPGVRYGSKHASLMLRPRRVEGPEDIVDIVAGYNHVIALRRDGRVWAWGDNTHGQLGRKLLPQRIFYEGCRREDGNRSANEVDFPHLMEGGHDVAQVFTSHAMTALVKRDHTLWFVGRSCDLCAGFMDFVDRSERMGRVAAKAMWCGREREVRTLRRAFNAYARTVRPDSKGIFLSRPDHVRRDMMERFQLVATQDYADGYDAMTYAIRHRPEASSYFERQPSREADRWWDALDLDRKGSDNGAEVRGRRLSVHFAAEDAQRYRNERCADIDTLVAGALNELAVDLQARAALAEP